eukprot:TRINITY_DN1765_c2_g1_i1.p1 TRINITY_DN1765_c2_g1~~TRINITY_DN1765_c2_g1_i1.p1  ORF type:complete len:310 (+),score=137.50 TRINITY_DN1765_c2_g1_i1:69-932(+)
MDPSVDPVMQLAGWRSDDTQVRGFHSMLTVAPVVMGVLLAGVVFFRYASAALMRGAVPKEGAPHGDELYKQMAFCLVGIAFHGYLGPAAIYGAFTSLDCPYEASVGNREALAGSQSEWVGVTNQQAVVGELFTGYAAFITVMWLLGWEEGLDKIVHHVVFLFLAVVLSGNYAFCRLSSFAMAMEMSTVPLNINMMTGWFTSTKTIHLVSGGIFILSFIAFRIFFFGYGLAVAISEFSTNPSAVPLPFPLSCLVLFLFSGGWLLQVYWTQRIVDKVRETLGGKKKKSE